MRLPTRHEVLVERLAILDQHIETLRATAADAAKSGKRGSGETERTLATLLESRAVYEQALVRFERTVDALVGDRQVPHPKSAPRGPVKFATDDDTLAVLLRAADLCVRRGNGFGECVHALVDAAMELTGAPMGNLQVLDDATGSLRIMAQRGFDEPFLRFFEVVSVGDSAACGQAMLAGARVAVEDVNASPVFADPATRKVLVEAGVRAVTSVPLVGSNGDVLGMVSVHFSAPYVPDKATLSLLDLLARLAADFLERIRTQRALETAARHLTQTFESAAFGLTRCSRDLRYLAANQAAARLLGLPVEQIVGRRIVDVMGAEGFARIRPDIDRVLAGERVEYEREVPYPGASRWVHVVYEPWIEGGEVVGWMASVADVTDRRRAQDELKVADHRKNEFLATLAHELRTPLAAIRTGVHLLRLSGTPAKVGVVEVIERQATDLARLVDELMDVSRISHGKIELKRETIDLRQVMHAAVDNAGLAIGSVRAGLHLDLPDEPVLVNADAMRLTQVFTNLLDNAAKYTDRGGRIDLGVECESRLAVVKVRDTGIGIAADELPHVFDLFAQGRTAPDARHTGLGVGLALVRSLVELHGGSVQARSDGPGRGSEFRVRLPLADTSSATRSESTENFLEGAGTPLAGRRILVVDDNRDAADATVEFLRQLGADVRTAYGGADALRAFHHHRPSVVFLDLNMPHVDGFAVARAIRHEDGDIAVRLVALTAWGQAHQVQRTREAGFDRHLVKPADPQALLAAVLDH